MPLPETICPSRPGFADLFAALPVAALVVGPDGRIAHANAAAEQMLNLSQRLLAGQPVDAVLRPLGDPRLQDGADLAMFGVEIATSHGHRLRVDLVETEVPGSTGWRMIVLREAGRPRTLGGTSDRAAAGRAAVGAAAMLAHEIKNPLSGIRGAAQLLGAGELTTLITTEVDRIAALIDRMEDFSDTRPLPLEGANIYPLLAHARAVALAGFARDVPIEERFDPSLPPARINPDALLQIVINLLKNAREAVDGVDEPFIALSTAYRHGMAINVPGSGARRPLPIEICVIDNGPGAPPDIVEALFDPFVSGRSEGRGLGLALVDKLARDMGGIVEYRRDPERSLTILRLLLPRAAS